MRLRFGLAVIAAMSTITLAHADAVRFSHIDVAHRFYQALDQSPRAVSEAEKAAAVGATLWALARVELTDFDITQTKDEFLASLVELDDALTGSRITHRMEVEADDDGAMLSVLVCYEFASNMVLNREILSFENGLISVVTQAPIADSCDAL